MATPRSALWGIFFFLALTADTSAHRSISFFPKYEYPLNQTVHNNCSLEYTAYLERDHNFSIAPDLTIWVSNSSYDPYSLLINCILSAMPELYKSNMASAQVLLGLTPSILARVGPSVYETAPLIASGRRPLLALFLIIGSPAVVVDPSFSFRQQLEDLRDPYKWTSPTSSQRAGIFIFLMEFLVALASIANIGHLSYQVATKSTFSFNTHVAYFQALWIAMNVASHLLSTIVYRTTVNIQRKDRNPQKKPWRLILHWLRLHPSLWNKKEPVQVQLRPSSFPKILFSWFTSTLSACNLIFGSLIFSSLLFISVRDAVIIAFRYFASAVFCRILVKYELSVFREDIDVKSETSGAFHQTAGPLQDLQKAQK
jgi:hypothetical protein